MIYLDTHVVVWLYAGAVDRISDAVKKLINENALVISPIVLLELAYLFEIKKVAEKPNEIISDLTARLGLNFCRKDFYSIILSASDISWTRDPFDRILVGNAAMEGSLLATKDRSILENYKYAVWE